MSNPSRKMATMRRVDEVLPIEGADRVEAVRVGGWTVVDRKGTWHPGDLCVYCEIDSFLPTGDERYAFLRERGERTMTIGGVPTPGHVLRTVRLRGQYSQGIVFKPQDVLPESVPAHAYETMCEKKARLDGLLNIREYHPDQNSLAAGFVGRYDPYVAPRTDAERIQNVSQEVFDLVRRTAHWASVKVDGTSITMCRDPRVDRLRVFSHNNEFDITAGQGRLAYETAETQGLVGFCEAFPGVTLQMELCGPKIGGNALGLEGYRLFVFSVWDMRERRYLLPYTLDGHESVDAVERSSVPYPGGSHGEGFLGRFGTPGELLEYASGMRSHVARGRLDEGLVVHVYDTGDLADEEWYTLRNALGDTMQVKAVSNAFLLKKARRG